MKIKQVTEYVCEICGESYDDIEKVRICESHEVSGDKGVKIGDIVLVLSGAGLGKKAKVTSIGVHTRSWGHHYWEKYWHTVYVNADLIGDWGSRSLSFDNYEPVK